ncbi:coatomer subunit beta-like [Hydractinia symbiolongicarpus]|uniref:coatomer subunit beta-like n=1 Tax=Hydractinia symbiolongicarpus TaxID=13093 RepID=UPI00254D7076|nr:coatomer subunit beta-like [Hydractinia symbiolongicarpus]
MTSITEQPCYTLVSYPIENESVTEAKLKEDLERGDVSVKISALKKVMYQLLNGEKMPSILMTIIRFVLPSQDHMIKKLLLIFWEIVPKTGQDGKLLHEMILVCDAYRKDLEHPNEFIRGSTLRFLCKLKEAELLEPLMPAIRACLEHRHSYVRRNAVFAIYTIYRNFEYLIPDAPELVFDFLEKEQDASCKRNAFMMLIHVDQERALDYLSSCIDQVHSFNEILQLVIVELIYKVCIANPQERARFIKCIYNLLNSSSNAVRYEAAGTLVTLSSAPTAIKAAATNYIELILKESDNNVKLIVLDKLIKLKESPAHEKVLQELVMDILRVLSSPDLEVRKKTLDLVLDLVTLRNIEEVVMVLKKEITKTHTEGEQDESGNYRQLLVRTLHSCCVKYPDVAPTVVPMLAEFLGDTNEQAALDVLLFIREAVLKFTSLKSVILEKLLENFNSIRNVKIHRHALWILGEHCTETNDILTVIKEIKEGLGEMPIVDDEMRRMAGNKDEEEEEVDVKSSNSRMVTADGTYATQSALVSKTTNSANEETRPALRTYLMKGDFFIGSAIGSTLTKLALRFIELDSNKSHQNKICAEAMLIMASIIHYGQSGLPEKPITEDDVDRLAVCIKVLGERNGFLNQIFNVECRNAITSMLEGSRDVTEYGQGDNNKQVVKAQADESIAFLQLFTKADQSVAENQFEISLLQAIGNPINKKDEENISSKLSKVAQLTGFSDPIYAEAYVNVNQYDIVLDVLIVNQTSDTLQNVTLELATLGDLKLVEKPSPVMLGAHDFSNIKASVKVASTENGIIFGNIVYDVSGGSGDRNCVVLNDIHIDIMDYIMPASCTDSEFRTMWAEFEWENKVSVNTNITDTREYLDHIIKCTNMKCLTPEKAISGTCGFMAANLYAKSIFGEDALANLSIEKPLEGGADALVIGHIRIRAKSQGMALSLGDKINLSQKKTVKN